MTAQDLRDEIDRRLEKHTNIILKELKEIKSMLDELEERPKAKWIIDEYGDYHCEKCNAIIEKDEWERHNYNYCYHCGARMNDEVDNGSSN